jgi:RNA polymerase sigma-70 factor, ECF subfamily
MEHTVSSPSFATSSTAPDDAELMRRMAGGDMTALGLLVSRHQDRVRGLAFRIAMRWDVADDIAQETFLRVYRSAGRYQPTAGFSTWLYRIVVNLCLDQAKKPKAVELSDNDACRGAPADAVLLMRERHAAIEREIAALPERQRVALVLHRFEGLNHRQVAEAMSSTESAVESLLVRAYSRLRDRLKVWQDDV